MKRTIEIICIIICLIGIFVINNYAEQATVVRDGSLLFELPDVNSSVVDILPRGRIVEKVAVSGEFTEVVLPESGTRGFLRNVALTGDNVSLTPPKKMSSMTAEESFNSMNRSLDNVQQSVTVMDGKINQIEELKDSRPMPVDMMEENEKLFPPVPFSSALSAGVFSGYLTEAADMTVGINALWFTRKLAGAALELEASYSSLEHERESYGFSVGLMFPFPWKLMGRLTPYVAAGAGMEWVGEGSSAGGAALASDNIAGFNLGGGIVTEISNRFKARADFRTMLKSSGGESNYEGRGYLSIMRDL